MASARKRVRQIEAALKRLAEAERMLRDAGILTLASRLSSLSDEVAVRRDEHLAYAEEEEEAK